MVQPSFETNASNAAPTERLDRAFVQIRQRKHTLEIEVAAQPLRTDPGERSFYGTNDNLSDRILKRDGFDSVFLSQDPVIFRDVQGPKCRKATLLQESVQLLKLWED